MMERTVKRKKFKESMPSIFLRTNKNKNVLTNILKSNLQWHTGNLDTRYHIAHFAKNNDIL